jgi:signal transduction histidine kinase/ligand-binding sensor domain-containing protein/DNA-binding response OmpR family regulator
MRKALRYIVRGLFFLFSLTLYAQKGALVFKHLTNSEGLSSNRINTIIEDSDGFMWFGTGDGINLCDSKKFKSFPVDANAMVLNPWTGQLLVGTEKGIEIFDKNLQKFDHFELKNKSGLRLDSFRIKTLYFTKNKRLLLGGDSFIVIDNEMNDFKVYHLPKEEIRNQTEITSIEELSTNIILLGTKNGLLKLDLHSGKFSTVYKDKYLGQVRKMFRDKKQNLWICTYNQGLCFVRNANLNSTPFFYKKENGFLINNRVIDAVEDQEGKFFVANIEGGLVYLDTKNNKVQHFQPDLHNPNGINGKAITDLFKDSRNNIWIGTYNSGVDLLDRHRKPFEHYQVNFRENGLFNNNIRALFQDSKGAIWVGTKEGGGLSKFNRANGTFENYKPNENNSSSLSDDYVLSIEELDANHLLIGTLKKGLDIFNKKDGRFDNILLHEKNSIYNMVYVIHKDLQGKIWMDYANEFYQFIPEKKQFIKINGLSEVKCILDKDKNNMWVGTFTSGMYLFNTTTKKVTKFDVGDNEINAIKKDSKGNLWIGTKSGIVCKKTGVNKLVKYGVEQGLPNHSVLALLVDNNDNIWASTTNGLSKLDQKNNKFYNYFVSDGLQGNEFEHYVALKTTDGELLFGGHNGFNIFNPKHIIENEEPLKVFFNDFRVFNKMEPIGSKNSPLDKDISQTSEITLKHKFSVITFGFVALNYSTPKKTIYAYKLEGFDKEWNYVGNRQEATYTNLPSGDYVFKVKASDSEIFPENASASINIEVLPAWYKTVWAYLLYSVLMVVLLRAFYNNSMVQFNLKNDLKMEQIEKENTKQLFQSKVDFFTNISHEFRTPLTLIIGPLERLLQSGLEDSKLKNQLQLINLNANRLLRLINQLMDFSKVEKGKLSLNVAKYNIVEVSKKIASSFNERARKASIDFKIESTDEEIWAYFDLEKYDIILFNLLSNAFKFTPDGGKISIAIVLVNENGLEQVKIDVIDTGKGISTHDCEHIFEVFYQAKHGENGTGIGLSLTKSLVELHKGTIAVQSDLGKGSQFSVQFLLGKKHFEDDNTIAFSEDAVYAIENYPIDKLDDSHTEVQSKLSLKDNKAIKVLLVEDNEELRAYLKSYLSEKYSVYEAADGVEGLKQCLKINPDIVISDVMMPEKNGLELCYELKNDLRISHIPVILLTARTAVENKIEGLKTGADAYIEKPFNIDFFSASITNLLESRKKLKDKFGRDLKVMPEELASSSADDIFLNKIIKIIENHIADSDFTVEEFIKEVGISRSNLHIKLKALTNKSATEFIRSIRLRKAAVLLRETDLSISEVAYNTGFAFPHYFSKCFRGEFGILPTEYRENK